jgi:hypothetical protein
MSIVITGRYEAMRTINAIATRLEYPEGAAAAVFPILEADYAQEFASGFGHYPGYLVETGATQEAWTDGGALGAIRNAHRGGLEFGSRIFYNRFHAGALLDHMETKAAEIEAAMSLYLVPPDPGEPKPSWWRPRDPRTGRFMKVR